MYLTVRLVRPSLPPALKVRCLFDAWQLGAVPSRPEGHRVLRAIAIITTDRVGLHAKIFPWRSEQSRDIAVRELWVR